MEIAKLSPNGIRVKTKQATIAITPQNSKGKVSADCVLLFDKKSQQDLPAFEVSPLIVDGAGEYEIKGVKFTGVSRKDTLSYLGKLDGVDVVFMQGSTVQKGKEMVLESQVAVIDADVALDQSTIAAFNAVAVVLYGEHAQESAKNTGKEATTSSKFVTTKDKLPSEMEVILLS